MQQLACAVTAKLRHPGASTDDSWQPKADLGSECRQWPLGARPGHCDYVLHAPAAQKMRHERKSRRRHAAVEVFINASIAVFSFIQRLLYRCDQEAILQVSSWRFGFERSNLPPKSKFLGRDQCTPADPCGAERQPNS